MLLRDYPIATELSHQVLQARRLRGELAPCVLDSRYLRRDNALRLFVVRSAFEQDKPQIVKARKVKASSHDEQQ